MCFTLTSLNFMLRGASHSIDLPQLSQVAVFGQAQLAGLLSVLLQYGKGRDINAILSSLVRPTSLIVGVGAGSAVVAPIGGTLLLGAAGFTGSGIAAGSFAAAFQSSVGSIAAGSTFSALQSIGATGGLAILGPVGAVAGLVGAGAAAGGYLAWKLTRKRNDVFVIVHLHV